MRPRFLLSLVLVACTTTAALSQTSKSYDEIGYFTDTDGQPIDDYADMTYQPKTLEAYTLMPGESYTPGYYYDLSGHKVEGAIKYSYTDGFLRFKSYAGGEEKSEKITPEMCQAYVLGRDSFVVINHFTVEREFATFHIDKPEFAEVLCRVGDLTFYQHTRSGISATGGDDLVYTFIVQRGNGALVSFSKSIFLFLERAPAYFKQVPYLAKGLKDGTLSDKDVSQMIRFLEYHDHAVNHTKIYYAASWEELKDSSEYGYQYYAEVSYVKEATWNLRYFFKDGTPLSSGSYTSTLPRKKNAFATHYPDESMPAQKKEGAFTFYFPDGSVRKTVEYKNDEITGDIKTYYRNGQMHYVYQKKNKTTHEYSVVADVTGKNVLDAEGSGTETFYDSLQSRTVTRTYKKNKLKDSYYTDAAGTKVYQYARNHAFLLDAEGMAEIKFSKRFIYPKSALSSNAYGTVRIRLLADTEGNTTQILLADGFDAACDKAVIGFCQAKYRGQVWIPLKVDQVKVPQEILLTFVLEIKPFSRYKVSYNTNPWHNRMLPQQFNTVAPASGR